MRELAHEYLRLKLLTSHGQLTGVSLSAKRLSNPPVFLALQELEISPLITAFWGSLRKYFSSLSKMKIMAGIPHEVKKAGKVKCRHPVRIKCFHLFKIPT